MTNIQTVNQDDADAGTASGSITENAVYRKITMRLVPLLFLAYLLAFLDRINVGYAKLQMSADLGFSEAVYGLGAGIFFISYLLFEVPSNLWLERVGVRITLCLLYTSPSPRDQRGSRMPSSA